MQRTVQRTPVPLLSWLLVPRRLTRAATGYHAASVESGLTTIRTFSVCRNWLCVVVVNFTTIATSGPGHNPRHQSVVVDFHGNHSIKALALALKQFSQGICLPQRGGA